MVVLLGCLDESRILERSPEVHVRDLHPVTLTRPSSVLSTVPGCRVQRPEARRREEESTAVTGSCFEESEPRLLFTTKLVQELKTLLD